MLRFIRLRPQRPDLYWRNCEHHQGFGFRELSQEHREYRASRHLRRITRFQSIHINIWAIRKHHLGLPPTTLRNLRSQWNQLLRAWGLRESVWHGGREIHSPIGWPNDRLCRQGQRRRYKLWRIRCYRYKTISQSLKHHLICYETFVSLKLLFSYQIQ